jgi:hypothetical protein
MRALRFATRRRNIRALIGSLAIFTALALVGGTFRTTISEAKKASDTGNGQDRPGTTQATFPADAPSLGAIPDAPSGCGNYTGAPRDVTFTVSGISGTITDVKVNTTFSPAHTWRGDLSIELRAPGGSPAKKILESTGSTTVGGCGSSNDAAGPYSFFDTAVPPAGSWWLNASTPTTAGNYLASTPGGVVGGGADTTITPTFAALGAAANGVWTLRILDGGGGDTGSISAASLEITAGPTVIPQHVVDFDGDGKTDPAVVRNTGGGPSGQLTWFIQNSSGAPATTTVPWGLNGDRYVPEDYDGDSKTDVAVWRAGPPFGSYFYILQSMTGTLRIDQFGPTGDDPTVVGDYDGDGKSDPAVYRAGAMAGDHSFWYYRSSVNGLIIGTEYGQNADFPAPGDYDGDGKNDFAVQRNAGGGQARFFIRRTTGGDTSVIFGTPTDTIVPGDYDGDGKYDIATIRSSGGSILWNILRSGDGGTTTATFGTAATDFATQGDWDGDGKTDIAVWRPNVDPTMDFFYIRRSGTGTDVVVEWGQNGDYPVANYNSH